MRKFYISWSVLKQPLFCLLLRGDFPEFDLIARGDWEIEVFPM